MDGVEKAAKNGMVVKVNSVLIPGLNDEHIVEIAKEVKKRGASLMNVLPLIPLNKMKIYERPGCSMMEKVQKKLKKLFLYLEHVPNVGQMLMVFQVKK